LRLDQLGPGVRATTPLDQLIRLYERRSAEIVFGIVDFSRVVGTVFNDYALNGVREGDAPGLRGVAVMIRAAGFERRVLTDAAGDFQVDDIAPGRYQVSLDAETIPANYVGGDEPMDVEVKPSSTATLNLPMRALRSIGGRVLLRIAGG